MRTIHQDSFWQTMVLHTVPSAPFIPVPMHRHWCQRCDFALYCRLLTHVLAGYQNTADSLQEAPLLRNWAVWSSCLNSTTHTSKNYLRQPNHLGPCGSNLRILQIPKPKTMHSLSARWQFQGNLHHSLLCQAQKNLPQSQLWNNVFAC